MKYDRYESYFKQYMIDVKDKHVDVSPYREALYITIWYIALGSAWILFSDSILNLFVKDPETIQTIQLIKGWLYVILTGFYIFTLIYFRMKLLKKATESMQESFENVSTMTEELLEKEHEIFKLSHYDRTSNLLNWMGLTLAFNELIDQQPDQSLTLYYIDIDNIKHVNDTLGHEQGNLLLRNIGSKLSRLTEQEGIVSRVSGDEFVLVLPSPEDDLALNKFAGRINNLLRTTWKVDKYEFMITASIGIAQYPDHGRDLDTLLKHADLAMFIAKDGGKDRHHVYDPEISQKHQKYIELIAQIRHGITKKEFLLYYQPIVELKSKKLVGVEALIRWQHPNRGLLTPYHFIDMAEESGQINEIGKWVFETACHQQKVWTDKGYPVKMSINVSGRRLFDPLIVSDINQVLQRYHVNPTMIQIEITETAVMENLNMAMEILENIRDLGIDIALDDFGTGYSSLTYLKMFPIDVLKIDKEFIRNISVVGMEKENSIINAVIDMAHSLELDIVAEGIEYSEQAEYLLINGCDYGQGYYYDRPMTLEVLEEKYFKR